ncbi:MAG: restriction endonuclease [Bacteroidetes bacterium]|nr:restriction endonuclease [Bacteroidota bacterium]
MNSIQYEEFCRFFLSKKLELGIERILSIDIPNPKRPGLPEYKHQIDLYWEIQDDFNLYLNIANAKWRGTQKVDLPEVILLQKVKEKVGAHKAFMITNNEFTSGAVAAAKDEGIALHVLKPNFKFANLPTKNRTDILTSLNEINSNLNNSIFIHNIVHKAFDFRELKKDNVPIQHKQVFSSGKIVTSYSNKSVSGGSNKSGSGGFSKGGSGFGGVTKGGGSGVTK